MSNYNNLSEHEKELYRQIAKDFWLNPKRLSLRNGLKIDDNFIEGAARAIYEDEEFPPKEVTR